MRAALLCVLALTGCSGGIGSSVEACMQKYAEPARSTLGVRAATMLCRNAHADPAKPYDVERAQCALPRILNSRTDDAVKLVMRDCN